MQNLANDVSVQAFIIPENPEEPYTSGINYSCIPSSKRIQPLQYLSDGEKSIANLALLFAILRYILILYYINEMFYVHAFNDTDNIRNSRAISKKVIANAFSFTVINQYHFLLWMKVMRH